MIDLSLRKVEMDSILKIGTTSFLSTLADIYGLIYLIKFYSLAMVREITNRKVVHELA
ncbi:hypothetical protein VFES401_09575 [Aliivibrio fischeri]|nr:hypothetical protein VFES401_09575 [Aliivibrio fischeri]